MTVEGRVLSGIKRGKRLVVLVGQKKAVAMTVRNTSDRRAKLQECVPSESR